jgi:hypothetical protein
MSFFKNKGQEGKTVPAWGLVPVGGEGYREGVKEDEYGGDAMYSCMKMEKKMRPIDTIFGSGDGDKVQ